MGNENAVASGARLTEVCEVVQRAIPKKLTLEQRQDCLFWAHITLKHDDSSECEDPGCGESLYSPRPRRGLSYMITRAAAFAKIKDPERITGDSGFLLPGMRNGVYHWQWPYIFVVVLFNREEYEKFGGLVGDGMGLRKVKPTNLLSVRSSWQDTPRFLSVSITLISHSSSVTPHTN